MKCVTVLAVLTTAVVLGCAPKQEQPREPLIPPPTTYSIPTPTATSTKLREQEAAEYVVSEYFRMKNAMKQNHSVDLNYLKRIVTGEVPEADIAQLEEDRKQGFVQKGDFLFSVMESELLETGAVRVTACTDASHMDLVDKATGVSVLDPERHFYKGWTFEVARFDTNWKITDFNTEDVNQCLV